VKRSEDVETIAMMQTPAPKWCPSVGTAAKELDKAIKVIGTSRNRLNVLRGKLDPSLNVCRGQSLMFQEPEAKLADPLLATIAHELCTVGMCLASDKKPLPVCTPKKADKVERCIAVCQSSLKCKIPVKA